MLQKLDVLEHLWAKAYFSLQEASLCIRGKGWLKCNCSSVMNNSKKLSVLCPNVCGRSHAVCYTRALCFLKTTTAYPCILHSLKTSVWGKKVGSWDVGSSQREESVGFSIFGEISGLPCAYQFQPASIAWICTSSRLGEVLFNKNTGRQSVLLQCTSTRSQLCGRHDDDLNISSYIKDIFDMMC